MANFGFIRKKVPSLTLGEKLKKLRGNLRLSLAEVSRHTQIQIRHLEFLENGQYDKLPADVYVRGFLRSYARYLNLEEGALIKLYEKERNIHTNLGHHPIASPTPRAVSTTALVITPRSILMTLIILSLGATFLYLYREFRMFSDAPLLIVYEPQNSVVIEGGEVLLRGKTDKGAQVAINHRSVLVDGDGGFAERLTLRPGINTFSVVAVNRFNKERQETLSVEARYGVTETPERLLEQLAEETKHRFSLQITAQEHEIKVVVTADTVTVFSGTLKPGDIKSFEAKEVILITSENGRDTLVMRENASFEPLSSESTPVKDRVFTSGGER